MKKKLLIALLAVAVLIGTFFIGSKIGATTSWTTEVISQASRDIGGTGFDKKNELIANTDITSQMKTALEPKIAEEQAELERLLEEYYQLKIAGLTDTDEFREVEAEIEFITEAIFERYRKEIDAVFVNP